MIEPVVRITGSYKGSVARGGRKHNLREKEKDREVGDDFTRVDGVAPEMRCGQKASSTS